MSEADGGGAVDSKQSCPNRIVDLRNYWGYRSAGSFLKKHSTTEGWFGGFLFRCHPMAINEGVHQVSRLW